ncbi:MAG TPA: TatD family hydrolase [Chthoniobacteraceae bacterium]|nr:TatD family hydrolase [Chthoniobacteraceae bacterium]
MLIDTHAHLDFSDFASDLDEVIARARDAAVTRIITIGTTIEGSRRAVALADAHPEVFAVVGIHPNHALEAPPECIAELRELARHPRVVAIGEVGLDYHRLPGAQALKPLPAAYAEMPLNDPREVSAAVRDGAVKAAQAELFTAQLDLAIELGLNVIIHERDAWQDTLEMLESFHGKVRTVFHCFGKSIEQARIVIDHGHLVSFTGLVTFKNAPVVHETAMQVPAGTFMVETDCPFLAPVPHRGKRCEPAHTRNVAERLGELRGVAWEEIARETTATAERFFRFP